MVAKSRPDGRWGHAGVYDRPALHPGRRDRAAAVPVSRHSRASARERHIKNWIWSYSMHTERAGVLGRMTLAVMAVSLIGSAAGTARAQAAFEIYGTAQADYIQDF